MSNPPWPPPIGAPIRHLPEWDMGRDLVPRDRVASVRKTAVVTTTGQYLPKSKYGSTWGVETPKPPSQTAADVCVLDNWPKHTNTNHHLLHTDDLAVVVARLVQHPTPEAMRIARYLAANNPAVVKALPRDLGLALVQNITRDAAIMTSTRAETARAFVVEAGRPDLAEMIGTNKAGNPTRPREGLDHSSAVLLAQAFAVAHDQPADEWDGVIPRLMRGVSRRAPIHWSPTRREWVDKFDPAEWRGVRV